MLGRVDVVDPASEDCRGAGGPGTGVRRPVYAPRQARDHSQTRCAQVRGQGLGESLTEGRGGPGTDDGDAGPRERIRVSKDPDHRWGRVDSGEEGREVRGT